MSLSCPCCGGITLYVIGGHFVPLFLCCCLIDGFYIIIIIIAVVVLFFLFHFYGILYLEDSALDYLVVMSILLCFICDCMCLN